MKPKTIITTILLLFVVASVVYLVIKETGGKPKPGAPRSDARSVVTGPNVLAQAPSENKAASAKVVIYYFHGNMRCTTCRTIEAYAKEAIDSGFADAIKDGHLEWQVVNVDEPDNEHYIQDFQLSTRSVVLERLADEKRQEWKNLQRVWELVRGDKDGFLKYVQNETSTYLEAAGK